MDAQEAASTLQDVEAHRGQARSDLQGMWFPLVLFGALTLVSAVVVVTAGPDWLGLFWLVAGPAGGAAIAVHSVRRERRRGVRRPAAGYVATAVAIVAGCLLLGSGGAALDMPELSAFGPPVVVAAGLFAFAALERSASLAAMAGVLLALPAALFALEVEPLLGTVVSAVAYGAVSLVGGLVYGLADGSSR